MSFRHVKVGDTVNRRMGYNGPLMQLTVVAVTDDLIFCGGAAGHDFDPETFGGWKFNRDHGYEVDEELGWGIPDIDTDGSQRVYTGSFLE